MEIFTEKKQDVSVISIKGKLDASTSSQFLEKATEVISGGNHKLIIDCKDLDYISSAGLRILYIILKEINNVNGKVVISEPNKNVLRVFDIVSLSSDINISQSMTEALEFIK